MLLSSNAMALIRATINDRGPLTGSQVYVVWGDRKITNLTNNAANFGFYETGDPTTRGIWARHLYVRGGTFSPAMYVVTGPFAASPTETWLGAVVLPGRAPTITLPAHVTSESGAMLRLTVAGKDTQGGDVTYSWMPLRWPHATPMPSLSDFADAGSATTTAQIYGAGDYTFDGQVSTAFQNISADSIVKVHVSQRASSLRLEPGSITVPPGGSYRPRAIVLDQFGAVMAVQPRVSWSVDAGAAGKVARGKYTAPQTSGVTDMLRATVVDASNGTITADLPISVSQEAVAASVPPGPITDFRAQRNDNGNTELLWTLSGAAADGFTIESQTATSGHWTPVATVPGNVHHLLIPYRLWSNTNLARLRITPFNAAGAGRTHTGPWIDSEDSYDGYPPSPIPLDGAIAGDPGQTDIVTAVNDNTVPLPGPFTVSVHAITAASLEGSVVLGSVTSATPLTAGNTAIFSVQSILPPSIPDGTYRLAAIVDDVDGDRLVIGGEIASFQIRAGKQVTATPAVNKYPMFHLTKARP